MTTHASPSPDWTRGLHWERLAAAVLGFVWFLQIGGGRTLNPANTDWIFSGDWLQHWLGWLFFRQEPWTFPLGTLTSLPYPIGTTIGFTDSNPLVSLLLKPFSGWLPAEMQFIGPWFAVCFTLQGYMGAALASTVTRDKGQQLLGGYLFVLSPVLVARLGHDTLCAHWLVLGVLYLGLREYPDSSAARRGAWLSTAAVLLAATIHPYLAAMCLVLALAVHVRLWRLQQTALWHTTVRAALTIAGMLSVFGSLGYFEQQASLGSPGFGEFSADAVTLVNPRDLSRLLPAVPLPESKWEGFGFLGLGGLLAIALATPAFLRSRPAPRARWPVFCAGLLMGAYALSSRIAVADWPVANLEWLYAPLTPLIAPFRASGRFIWALHYLALLFGLWGAVRLFGRRHASANTAALALIVVVQASDLHMGDWWSSAKKFRQAPIAEFDLAKGKYRHLALVPMQVLGVCGDPFQEEHVYRFMLHAYRLGTTYNSGVFARVPKDRVAKECGRFEFEVDAGTLDAETIYVLPLGNVDRFRRAGATCGRFDGDWICVSGDSDAAFRTLVDSAAPWNRSK